MGDTHPGDLRHLDVTVPVYARVQSCEGFRSAALYERCIDQHEVATNPRYQPRDTSGDGKTDTHCDAFLAAVADSMGCYLPPAWRGKELSANGTIDWLDGVGRRGYGYFPVDLMVARRMSCEGSLVIAAWKNEAGGSGHVAVVRPSPEAGELVIAQAGRICFDRGPLSRGFGNLPVRFIAHP